MSEDFMLEHILKWKKDLELKIEQINSTLKEKEKRLETLEIKMSIVKYVTRNFSINVESQDRYWNKYGKHLEDENASLTEEQQNSGNELNTELRELKCLLAGVNEYIGKNTEK